MRAAAAFLAAVVLSGAGAARAETHPKAEAGVIFGTGLNASGGDVIIRVDFLLNRGEETFPQIEPMFYFAHLSVDGSVLNTDGGSDPYLDMKLGLVGAHMEEWDTSLRGEGLQARLTRNYAIDQDYSFRISVLGGGEISAMLPFWREDGKHDLYFKILADVLGYKMVDHVKNLATFHGIYVGNIGAELGASIYPTEGFPITLAVGGMADLSVSPVSGSTYSDQKAYVALRAKWKNRVKVFVEGSALRSVDGQVDETATALQLLGGVVVAF